MELNNADRNRPKLDVSKKAGLFIGSYLIGE